MATHSQPTEQINAIKQKYHQIINQYHIPPHSDATGPTNKQAPSNCNETATMERHAAVSNGDFAELNITIHPKMNLETNPQVTKITAAQRTLMVLQSPWNLRGWLLVLLYCLRQGLHMFLK